MVWTWDRLSALDAEVGEEMYLLDTARFAANYDVFLASLRRHYPASNIAYSYKTNYAPPLCGLVDTRGGLAEVVSEMELELAERLGVPGERIVYNGPYKRPDVVERALLSGVLVNLDGPYEVTMVEGLAARHPKARLNLGLRCHVPFDGVSSRFGFDTGGEEFRDAVARLCRLPGCGAINLHAHVLPPKRRPEDFRAVLGVLIDASRHLPASHAPKVIDVGGGFFSPMPPALAAQFGGQPPSFDDYGRAIGQAMAVAYPSEPQPTLLIEPGMALVADAMSLAAKVVATRMIGERRIALVASSVYSARPTGSARLLPFTVVRGQGPRSASVAATDVVGYTCMEHDCLLRGTRESIEAGDYLVFDQVGAYTNVLRPSFIEPGPPMVSCDLDGVVSIVKRRERMSDVFASYRFASRNAHVAAVRGDGVEPAAP